MLCLFWLQLMNLSVRAQQPSFNAYHVSLYKGKPAPLKLRGNKLAEMYRTIIVDALMKQVTYPNLNGVIKFNPMSFDRGTGASLLPITIGIFNFSPFQNEEMISFRVLSLGAYFQRSRTSQIVPNRPYAMYNMNGHQLIFEDFADIIHFGTPRIYNDVLVIDNETLKEDAGMLTLSLSFGGKKSPAKTSSYSLDFSSNNIKLATPNDLLIEIEENLLFSELQQRLNKTVEDSLDAFLER